MSSRSGPGSGFNSHLRHTRERERDASDDGPPRLPSLRALAAQRDRDNTSPTWNPARNYTRHWTPNSIRRERLRQIENRERNAENRDPSIRQASLDDYFPGPNESWLAMSRRTERMRNQMDPPQPASFEFDQYLTAEEEDSNVRLLLDLQNQISPDYPVQIPNFSPPLRPQEQPDTNRRHKRRKLDSDRLVPSFQGFRYGKYGQVEPGPLQMEIVSCDGGMFSNESSYSAENVLHDDLSVYCTKGNRCNIVLRHQGATVFSLQELVIKAPASMSYSHPVREGMVFIAMNQDDILNRTSQYQIQYSPKADEEPPQSGNPMMDITNLPRLGRDGSLYHPRTGAVCNENGESRTPQMPPEFASDLPDFRVTIECSEEENDGRAPFRHGANHIGSLPFENNDSDEDDNSNNPFGEHLVPEDQRPPSQWRYYHNFTSPPTYRDRLGSTRSRNVEQQRPSGSGLTEAWEAHTSATQDAVRAVGGGELLTPHARFNIEKHKSKCSIRFDPPVSGRFILLKMWSSHHDPASNIDIQCISAHGFAGPRYFPSVDLA
ncbi:hypothetical protein B0T10DRAFT_321521 [Thelonectria olida]|uniref:Uncharacterized protein n=1 Tax=Thelonectria olida TaxID=1576542 RepID=A0A9P8W557_9HYPO|nr:hypothetical protein B0T10DRAFT_321521 [Thelonectria olida]